MAKKGAKRTRGFTLIEVLVATAVIAIALPPMLMGVIEQLDGISHMRERSLARFVALNKIAELRIANKQTGKTPKGRGSGIQQMANLDWYWQSQSEKSALENFYRIEITVRAGDNQDLPALARAVSYLNEFTPDLPKKQSRAR